MSVGPFHIQQAFSAGCTTTVCVPRVPIWTQPLPVISIDSVAGVMVSIVAFQAVDPGSIPGRRSFFFCCFVFFWGGEQGFPINRFTLAA